MDLDLDAAMADVMAEFGVSITLTLPGGLPVAVTALYWERPPEGKLDTLQRPHDGPVAEIRVSDLAAQGLGAIPDQSALQSADGRTFTVRRAPLNRSGILFVAELDEAP